MKKLIYIILLITSFGYSQSLVLLDQLRQEQAVPAPSLSTANVRLIVGNSASLVASDNDMISFLTPLVGTLQVVSDESYTSVAGTDITVISESINSGLVAAMKTEDTPIITLEGGNWDEFEIGTSGDGARSITTVTLVNSHPILTGVTFPLSYNTGGAAATQGFMDKGSNALSAAYLATSGGNSYHFIAFNTGDTLEDLTTATNKRVYISGNSPVNFSTGTELVFENALKWCFGSSL